VDVLLPACNGQSAAATVRLLQLLMGRMGGNATAAAVDVGGEATCVSTVAAQLPTAAAINSELYCGFPQVLINRAGGADLSHRCGSPSFRKGSANHQPL
jgi:hypothetical protein